MKKATQSFVGHRSVNGFSDADQSSGCRTAIRAPLMRVHFFFEKWCPGPACRNSAKSKG
jgi:hypothetical protein